MILEEEIEEMLESSNHCSGTIQQETNVIAHIDRNILQLDEEVIYTIHYTICKRRSPFFKLAPNIVV